MGGTVGGHAGTGAGAGGASPQSETVGAPVLAPPERRTRPQIMLDTLIAATMCILRTGVLPTTGGAPTQVIVTLDGADLLAALRNQTPTPAETGTARNAQGTRHAPNARDRAPSATPDTPEPDEPFDPRSRPGPTASGLVRSGRPPNADTNAPADTDAPVFSERDLDGVAWLIHEGPVSLRSVRRLACDADLVPVVLGTGSRVLDLGRSHRLIPAWMRTALTARDGGCLFPGCHIPATWCDAHHIIPWYQGGATSTDNAALLCGYHHHLIHTGDWTITTPRPGATPTITPGPELTPTYHRSWAPPSHSNRYHRC